MTGIISAAFVYGAETIGVLVMFALLVWVIAAAMIRPRR